MPNEEKAVFPLPSDPFTTFALPIIHQVQNQHGQVLVILADHSMHIINPDMSIVGVGTQPFMESTAPLRINLQIDSR